MQNSKLLLKSTKAQLLIIIFLTFLAYSNIFQNQFVGDDITFIVNWDIPKSLSNFPEILSNHSVPEGHEGGYRPVRTLALAMLYQFFRLNPFGYHIYSIFIHLSNTTLVFLITRSLSKNNLTAFLAGLLFGVHPIHTENVTFILGSIDTLGFFFYLASFYLYLISKIKGGFFLTGSLTLAFLAFLTNELTITLPVFIIFYEFCFEKKPKLKNLKRKFSLFLSFFSVLILYSYIRIGLLNIFVRGAYLENSFYLTMLTMTKAVSKYISLIIWPDSLSINQLISPGIQTLANIYTQKINSSLILNQKIYDQDIFLSLVAISILVFTAFISIKKNPLLTFSVGTFFIGLMPASFIFPQGNIFQERYAYLASFGLILFISLILVRIPDLMLKFLPPLNLKSTVFTLIIALPFLTFYPYQTYLRNKDWQSPLAMAESLARQLPFDIPTLLNLARLYEEKKDYKKAIKIYRQILVLNPNLNDVYIKTQLLYKGLQDEIF